MKLNFNLGHIALINVFVIRFKHTNPEYYASDILLNKLGDNSWDIVDLYPFKRPITITFVVDLWNKTTRQL